MQYDESEFLNREPYFLGGDGPEENPYPSDASVDEAWSNSETVCSNCGVSLGQSMSVFCESFESKRNTCNGNSADCPRCGKPFVEFFEVESIKNHGLCLFCKHSDDYYASRRVCNRCGVSYIDEYEVNTIDSSGYCSSCESKKRHSEIFGRYSVYSVESGDFDF